MTDGIASYDAALHALSGRRPTLDKDGIAIGIVDLLMNSGCDPDDVLILGTLVRAEACRRKKAAKRIERLTKGAGRMGLNVPGDPERVVPKY